MCSRYHKWRGKESRKCAPGRPGHIEQPALTGRWVAPQGCTRVKSGFDFPILLEEVLASSGLPLPEVVPLFAALLALPLPACYPPSWSHHSARGTRPWKRCWRGCSLKRHGNPYSSSSKICTGWTLPP
jgi:hypothetical protein